MICLERRGFSRAGSYRNKMGLSPEGVPRELKPIYILQIFRTS